MAIFSPSTDEMTLMAGVMIPSPNSSPAAIINSVVIQASLRFFSCSRRP